MVVNGEKDTHVREKPQQELPIKLDVIVVGAGISGLATAISTALSGHNVTVFESAKELLEVRGTAPGYLETAKTDLTPMIDRCWSSSYPKLYTDSSEMGPRRQTMEIRGRAALVDGSPLLGNGPRP